MHFQPQNWGDRLKVRLMDIGGSCHGTSHGHGRIVAARDTWFGHPPQAFNAGIP